MKKADDLTGWIRVSSILKMVPTLIETDKWDYPMEKIDPIVLQNAANRGINVHSAIHSHINGAFPVLNDEECAYFNSYLKWEKSVSLKCHQIEQRLFHEPMNLTGCIDMIGKVHGGDFYQIIDFKCTSSPHHKKWTLQAAFYAFLAKHNGMTLESSCLFVQLSRDGSFPKVHKYIITDKLRITAMSLYNAYIFLTEK